MTARYVCGFALHEDEVLLIHKRRPEWQRGRWNGVGGHIEPGESPEAAMAREFAEETGAAAGAPWEHFATLTTDHGSEVVFFRARCWRRLPVAQTTDEEPRWWPVAALPLTIPNLRWLIPMALNEAPGCGMPFAICEAEAPAALPHAAAPARPGA